MITLWGRIFAVALIIFTSAGLCEMVRILSPWAFIGFFVMYRYTLRGKLIKDKLMFYKFLGRYFPLIFIYDVVELIVYCHNQWRSKDLQSVCMCVCLGIQNGDL